MSLPCATCLHARPAPPLPGLAGDYVECKMGPVSYGKGTVFIRRAGLPCHYKPSQWTPRDAKSS